MIAASKPLILRGRAHGKGRVQSAVERQEDDFRAPEQERERLAEQEKKNLKITRRLKCRVNPVRGLVREPTLTCKACGRRYLREALQRQAERDTAAAFAKGVEQIMTARCVCGGYDFD